LTSAVGHQGQVAQGDGAVVDAATKVDGIALLDVVVFAHRGEAAFDGIDLADAHHRQHQHRQYQGKAQSQSYGDAE
jgi:hypothetical protein